MATQTDPAAPEREGAHPLLIVAATVLTVVALSFAVYAVSDPGAQDGPGAAGGNLAGSVGAGSCGQGTPAGANYSVDVLAAPDPPRPEGTTFSITPRRDGTPVTGAKVCLIADMPDMEHPALNAATRETSPGRYETRIQFGMGGTWKTAVTVAEPDKPVVSLPITIQVAQVEGS
jgi:hypothetical protein